MRGRFISLEGGEGVGKTTQRKRLMDTLAQRGIPSLLTREPGGSEGAEAIRGLLMSGEVARWNPRTEALLFAAARSDHVERVIRPALEAGTWVVCDRYVDSTRAYQGIQGLEDADILSLHAFGSQGLMPDRTLILTLPAGIGEKRAEQRDGAAADRFAKRGGDFHRNVAERFSAIAIADPDRVRIIDAAGTEEQVTERLLDALGDMLPG